MSSVSTHRRPSPTPVTGIRSTLLLCRARARAAATFAGGLLLLRCGGRGLRIRRCRRGGGGGSCGRHRSGSGRRRCRGRGGSGRRRRRGRHVGGGGRRGCGGSGRSCAASGRARRGGRAATRRNAECRGGEPKESSSKSCVHCL